MIKPRIWLLLTFSILISFGTVVARNSADNIFDRTESLPEKEQIQVKLTAKLKASNRMEEVRSATQSQARSKNISISILIRQPVIIFADQIVCENINVTVEDFYNIAK